MSEFFVGLNYRRPVVKGLKRRIDDNNRRGEQYIGHKSHLCCSLHWEDSLAQSYSMDTSFVLGNGSL